MGENMIQGTRMTRTLQYISDPKIFDTGAASDIYHVCLQSLAAFLSRQFPSLILICESLVICSIKFKTCIIPIWYDCEQNLLAHAACPSSPALKLTPLPFFPPTNSNSTLLPEQAIKLTKSSALILCTYSAWNVCRHVFLALTKSSNWSCILCTGQVDTVS